MENTYRVSHTAYPDGSIIRHIAGMNKPEALNIGDILKHSLFKAAKHAKKRLSSENKFDNRIFNLYALR